MPLNPASAWLLAVLATTAAAQLPRQDLPPGGETLAGAFVTMTPGARCPSASTIAFSAQGEATGRLDGVFDARGTFGVALGGGGAAPSIRAFSAQLAFNQQKASGSLTWDPADAPLSLTCDPLSLRVEGRLRYTIAAPFEATGAADVQAYGSRSAVTQPYFGRIVIHLVPAGPAAPPR